MSRISRRTFVTAGLTAAASASGLGIAAKLAQQYGLIAPDVGGVFGPGEGLTYAANRIFATHAMAREFPRSMISTPPFANSTAPPNDEFRRLQSGAFSDWRLAIEGLVARPRSFSLADLRTLPVHSQITEVVCEEGWSYVAEWTGTRLHDVLNAAGLLPGARYLAYFSIEPEWWDSLDIEEALHPQTLLAWAMNGGDLPVPFGGPLRMRVPRQLGYKSVKFITRLLITDNVKGFVPAVDPTSPNYGYAWYAGI
jgi:DMSO/TMAO reductase YedYZ molybdopterin-dependent catalytic subunit